MPAHPSVPDGDFSADAAATQTFAPEPSAQQVAAQDTPKEQGATPVAIRIR